MDDVADGIEQAEGLADRVERRALHAALHIEPPGPDEHLLLADDAYRLVADYAPGRLDRIREGRDQGRGGGIRADDAGRQRRHRLYHGRQPAVNGRTR